MNKAVAMRQLYFLLGVRRGVCLLYQASIISHLPRTNDALITHLSRTKFCMFTLRYYILRI